MESPIPILPLSTPDVDTEKLIKMKDEEVGTPPPQGLLKDAFFHRFANGLTGLFSVATQIKDKFKTRQVTI